MVLAAGAAARGLEVDDDERGFAQRHISVESQWLDVSEAELAHALTVGNRTDKCRQAGLCHAARGTHQT